MIKIVKEEDVLEFLGEHSALFVVDNDLTIKYYLCGDTREMEVTKEDYILFDATRKLYENIVNKNNEIKDYEGYKKESLSKFFKKKNDIIRKNKIEIHNRYGKKSQDNILYISKEDEDTYKYKLEINNKENPGVDVSYDNNMVYGDYANYFKDFFDNIYYKETVYHQMNLEEYAYSLKLKK